MMAKFGRFFVDSAGNDGGGFTARGLLATFSARWAKVGRAVVRRFLNLGEFGELLGS
jgi:hypothetical protein